MTDHVALLDGGRLRLSEPTHALQARFRCVEVDVPPESRADEAGGPLPAGWLEFARSGQRVSFVDSTFDAAESPRAYGRYFPGRPASSRPMTLREIFLTLARVGRSEMKGAA